jgi:hypothetical protein
LPIRDLHVVELQGVAQTALPQPLQSTPTRDPSMTRPAAWRRRDSALVNVCTARLVGFSCGIGGLQPCQYRRYAPPVLIGAATPWKLRDVFDAADIGPGSGSEGFASGGVREVGLQSPADVVPVERR